MADQAPPVKAPIAARQASRQDIRMTNNDQTTTAPAWRTLLQTWGPRALFESTLIVLSISLALTLNAWMTDLQTAARVREARVYFLAELRANRAMLLSDAILPHHNRLRDMFMAVPQDRAVSIEQATPVIEALFQSGVHIAPLRDVAWRTFSNSTLLEHMDLEQVFALNDAYQAQVQVQQLQAAYYPTLAQLPTQMAQLTDFRAPIQGVGLHLSDVVAAEEGAIARYDAAITSLTGETAAAPH